MKGVKKAISFSLLISLFPAIVSAQKINTITDSLPVKLPDSLSLNLGDKEVKNRNVMLSAESSTTPRQLNIGLPFQGDILILENEIPVVYTFWTQIPTTAWRYDATLGRIGLMSFSEGALTYGKVGYIVTSWDREPGSKFKGFVNTYVNNYGSFRYDAALTGPLNKKGWGYMVGMNQTYDRGSGTNYQFTPYADRAQFIKVGLSKKYKQGNIRFYFKYADTKPILGAYAPLVYEGNGKTRAADNFKLGKDSYIVGSGIFPYYDYNSGSAKWGDINSNEASQNVSKAFYLMGEHRFKNGFKLDYSSMYMKSKAAFTIQYPISLSVTDPDQRSSGEVYMVHGTNTAYTGAVQLVSSQNYPQVDINTFITKVELTKKVKMHSLRAGMTFQYYNAPIISNGGLYYQTVEANPKIVDRYVDLSVYGGSGYAPVTTNGLLPTSGIGSYQKTLTKKTALFASDDFTVNKWLSGGIGARLENQYIKDTHDPYVNQFVNDRAYIVKEFRNKWNTVFTGNILAKVNREFGFLADVTYNQWFAQYWDYAASDKDENGNPITNALQNVAKGSHQSVLNYGGGIYWNHGNLISLVSKVTRITKKNIISSATIVNPSNTTEQATFNPIFYDISTVGWTTDIVSEPFKNFHLHYLLTLQNPQYKNYSYSAFNVTYSYSNKIIPELSKILMEIDPSYFMLKGDLKLWLSLRYFGKQYGNPTNVFYYKGWWESFGGVGYKMNKNVELNLQLVNILNQTGIKGALVGADQITDVSSFVGRKIVAGAIRPRTLEITASFKF